MTSGGWQLEEGGTEINCVVPKKLVTPVLTVDKGSSAPEVIKIRRTFETWPRRLLARAAGAKSTRTRSRVLEKFDRRRRVARYRSWSAACYSPWRRPTLFEFYDPTARRKELSELLQVFHRDVIVWIKESEFEPYLKGEYGPVKAQAGMRIKKGEQFSILLDVAVDPEVEPFAFSPVQHIEGVGFDSYVETCVTEIGEALDTDGRLTDRLWKAFDEDYGDFVGDTAGQIYASFDSDRVRVEPGQTSSVRVTLHCEREGRMLMAVGVRHLGTGEIYFSELLPLVWEPERDKARASHEESARKQAMLKRKAGSRSRLSILGST